MKSVLSIDPNTVTAKAGDSQPDLKPVTIPLQVKPKIEEISPEKLNELHKQEDVVLEKITFRSQHLKRVYFKLSHFHI